MSILSLHPSFTTKHGPMIPHDFAGRGGVTYFIDHERLAVVTKRGHVDWPIKDFQGNILYEFPERVPQKLKEIVKRAFRLYF